MIGGLTYVPLSDIGVQREENQDYQGHDLTPQGFLFIVADGMGGHAGGATASQMTVNHTRRAFNAMDPDKPIEALQDSIQIANRAIWTMAAERPELHGMGSTVVALLVQESQAYIAHVGDSRIYLLRNRKLHQLTKDHTMVQRLVDEGVIAPEQAENHQKSHILNRSLGGKSWVRVDARPDPIALREGDIFLLCSDGLTGLVDDDEIGRILLNTELHHAARIMVDEVNARGGFDNTTIALVRVDKLPLDVRVESTFPPPEMFDPPREPEADEPQEPSVPDEEPEAEPDAPEGAVEAKGDGDESADSSEKGGEPEGSSEDGADGSEEPPTEASSEETSEEEAPGEEPSEDDASDEETNSDQDEAVAEEAAESGDDQANEPTNTEEAAAKKIEARESPLGPPLPSPEVASKPIDDDGVGSYRITKLRDGMPALLYTDPTFPKLTEPEQPAQMSTGTMLLILIMGLSAGLLLGFVLAQTLNKAPIP